MSIRFSGGLEAQTQVEVPGPLIGPEAADQDGQFLFISQGLNIPQYSSPQTLASESRQQMDFCHVEKIRPPLELEEAGVSII